MCTTVNDVKRWNWHNEFIGWLSSKSSQVLIKRNSVSSGSSSGGGQRYGQDGVSTKFSLAPSPFVLGTVKFFDHLSVNLFLVSNIHAGNTWADELVNVFNGLKAPLTKISIGILVSQLESFINTGRCTTWYCGSENLTILEDNVSFDGWVSSTVEDFSGSDRGNGRELSLGGE
jgi:hypothetical protein